MSSGVNSLSAIVLFTHAQMLFQQNRFFLAANVPGRPDSIVGCIQDIFISYPELTLGGALAGYGMSLGKGRKLIFW